LPEECDGDGPPTWQSTGAVDAMSTTIVFGDAHVDIREVAVTATIGHFATARLGWSFTAGGIVGGSIEGRDLRGGATVAGAVSWLPVYERESRPFVALSASLGTALASAVSDDGSTRLWSAWDLRGGVIAGKTFAKRVVPYAAARVFGGPVFWRRGGEGVTGGDRWHVTAGAGLTLRLPARLDATVEVMPLGEQSATGAVTAHL
jgi:hypothetical protein